jgi:Tfp pilus assembly protein PilV
MSLFHKVWKNHLGMSLVEVLLAASIVGGGALLVMNLAGENRKVTTQSEADKEISQASGEIFSLLMDPANCNANFFGLTTGTGSITAISKCVGGNCRSPGSGVKTTVFPVSASWMSSQNMIGNNVRISSITYRVNRMIGIRHSTLFLDVVFNKNTKPSTTMTKRYGALVVVDGTAILGCPKSWNSTIPY